MFSPDPKLSYVPWLTIERYFSDVLIDVKRQARQLLANGRSPTIWELLRKAVLRVRSRMIGSTARVSGLPQTFLLIHTAHF